MDNQRKRGRDGESLAEKYLIKAGYRVLEKNYQKRYGEIDLIAEKDSTLVFVEVKLRKSTRYGLPSQAVNVKKQQKIVKTAMAYLAEHGGFERAVRFDIIEIFDDGVSVPKLRHLQGAFRPV